jgi:hypothetical protein
LLLGRRFFGPTLQHACEPPIPLGAGFQAALILRADGLDFAFGRRMRY